MHVCQSNRFLIYVFTSSYIEVEERREDSNDYKLVSAQNK